MESRTKVGQVASYLPEGINSGRFARGRRLKQAVGYLSGSSYRGMTVVGFDPTASRETIQLRLILESELLRHFVTNATDADVKEHADLAAKFAYTNAAPTSSGTRAANYQLHRHMYELARLPQTLQFVEILWSRCPFYTINEFEGRTDRAAREHSEILLHIAARDVELAVNATCRHIVAGWEALPSS